MKKEFEFDFNSQCKRSMKRGERNKLRAKYFLEKNHDRIKRNDHLIPMVEPYKNINYNNHRYQARKNNINPNNSSFQIKLYGKKKIWVKKQLRGSEI